MKNIQEFLRLLAAFLLPLAKEDKILTMTNREKLYFTSLAFLGQDASPADEAYDAVGCMDTVTSLIEKVKPEIKWTNRLSTMYCERDMDRGRSFVRTREPLEGDIVMSATDLRGVVGHVGIVFPNQKIASNDSRSGLFDINYTMESWQRHFVGKKGLKMHFYRML